jgi:uncharacterized membrane protein
LTEKGQQLYEEIRGFAYFLAHVEKPRLQQMMKEDAHYVDTVLPRAILLGLETKFLEAVEEVAEVSYQPDWYTGEIMLVSDMVSSLKNATKQPVSSSSQGSGGGGSSGFSG